MKKYIRFLVLSLVLVVTTIMPVIASASTITISQATVPSYHNTWRYRGNGEGWTVNRYATQKYNINTTEQGYNIRVGFL